MFILFAFIDIRVNAAAAADDSKSKGFEKKAGIIQEKVSLTSALAVGRSSYLAGEKKRLLAGK